MKAFDKVPHGKSVDKIESLGIVGSTCNWLEDGLKDRQQVVINENAFLRSPVASSFLKEYMERSCNRKPDGL